MFIPIFKIIALLPLLILMTSIFIIVLSIILKRNHVFVFFTTIFSLLFILVSLFFIYYKIPITITSLLYINFYSIIYIFIVITSSISIVLISYFFLEKWCSYKEEFYVLLLSSIAGSIILIEANHIFSIFIGIELMSFPLFGLMIYFCKKENIIPVILKYLLFSSIITSFSLLGTALIYLVCGTLKLTYIKISFLIYDIVIDKILSIGVICLFMSFFFKLSLFPLHFWVYDVYKKTAPVVLMCSTTFVKVSIFAALMHVISYCPYKKCQVLYLIIEMISISSIIFGSVIAAFQNNIKKFFGCSSIVHMGYVLTTLLILENSYIANNVSLFYFINYTISSIGIFSILSLFMLYNDKKNAHLTNLSVENISLKKKLVLTIAIFIIIFSFLGFPLTYGFITKYFIILTIIQKKLWFILFSVIINSGFGIYYYFKVLFNVCNKNNLILIDKQHSYKTIEYLIIAFGILIMLCGIFPQIIMNILQSQK